MGRSFKPKLKPKKIKQVEAAAYHEAGHAVACVRFGFAFTEVRIGEGGAGSGAKGAGVGFTDSTGLTELCKRISPGSPTEDRDQAEAWGTQLLCGYVAEDLFLGTQELRRAWAEATASPNLYSDLNTAATLGDVLGENPTKFVQESVIRAKEFVSANQDAIGLVAQALLQTPRLSAESIHHLVQAVELRKAAE